MGRDMNDTEKKCVIITAGCFIDDETRRGTPIFIPNGDVVHCIPLYPTILEDGNRLTTGMAIFKGNMHRNLYKWRGQHSRGE